MKKSQLRQIIKEEISNTLTIRDLFGDDFPFDYVYKPEGDKIIIPKEGYNDDGTLFDMKDDWKEKIIRTFREKMPNAVAKPNMGGGVTVFLRSSMNEGTFHGPREIAIYDGPDGETYIEKRGLGYYGYNNSFDFEAEDKAELKWKLDSWGYRLIAGSIDESVNESMIPTIRDINKMSKDQLIRIQGILFGRSDQKKILNAIRKRLEQIDSDISEDEGISYLTPDAFDKNKKSTGASDIYYYKLGFKPVPKKIKGAGTIVKKLWEKEELTEYSDFQQKRISTFDEVEEKLNSLSPLLSNAKNETAKYYNENPGSYAIVYSTDMVSELLGDITDLLKQTE